MMRNVKVEPLKKRGYNSSGLCPIQVPFGSQNITIEKTLTVTRIPYYVCKISTSMIGWIIVEIEFSCEFLQNSCDISTAWS
jgi:hypothetical protein